MEVIRLPGYTEDEKQQHRRAAICCRSRSRQNGLKDGEAHGRRSAILDIIRHYTRESGVRNLERETAKICRKAVKQLLLEPETESIVDVTAANLDKFLGVRRFRFGRAEEAESRRARHRPRLDRGRRRVADDRIGGGARQGQAALTGQLGEVMQESIQAAMTVVRSRADLLGLENRLPPEDRHSRSSCPRARRRRTA